MLHRSAFVALAAAAVLSLGACDTDDTALDVFVVDFEIDTSDPGIRDEGRVASYNTDDVVSPSDEAAVRDVLRDAGDGSLVVAYARTRDILDETATPQTYSGLPITRGFEGTVLVDEDDDGDFEEVPFVDFLVTYEYSFDNQDFYFDAVSSAALDFADFLPANLGIRLVVIPDELFRVNGQAGARVDLGDYEAVKRAYGLPD